MKFLCGNCKAKYQIADAKVAGRTLRMKCRRCGHDILIQGEGDGGGQSNKVGGSTVSMPPSPPPGRSGAGKRMPPPVPPPAPSALGAGFRRGLAAASERPRTPAQDQWHVAIHDVPVGPMSREEVARKITAGAAGPQSLCWREGMDDWRPLEDVPELAALLGRGGAASRAGLRPVPGPRAGGPLPSDDFDDEFGEPTRVADASQLRGGSSSMPAAMPAPAMSGSPTPSPTPSMAPEPSQPAAVMPSRQQMSPWALIGIGMALAAGLLGAPLAIMKIYQSPEQPQPAASNPASPPAPAAQAPQEAVPELELNDLDEEIEEEEEAPEQAAKPTRKTGPGTKQAAKKAPTASNGKKLTAEQQALVDRMKGGSGPTPGNLGTTNRTGGGGGGGGQSLNASQLTSVVKRNRPGLQRCYEGAMRATSSTETLRINVKLTVGISGTVTRVNATGASMGNLTSCIESTVKRWRFPSSSGATEFAFPVLFQPGG